MIQQKLLSFIKNFIVTRKHLDFTLQKTIEPLNIMVQQQQILLNQQQILLKQQQVQLKQQEGMLRALQQTQQQTMIANVALWTYASGHPAEAASSRKTLPEQFTEKDHPLAFLESLYCLHDVLKDTSTMEILKQDYVNAALTACLTQLHAEQDPSARQLIYDALKNVVFDDLVLTGQDASFYTDESMYQEMCKIVNRAYDYNYFSVLSKPFYEQALVKWYHRHTGGELNLKNPITYNDKINWLKLNEHDARKTQYSDKYTVREYVADTIGHQYLIPLINVWEDVDDIDFEQLPDQFVLKATHGSGWNIIVPDKSALDIPDAVKRMKWWMGRKLSFCNGLELHYDGIKPRIIAEQYLENSGGELHDYKVWCFGGKAHFIQYLADRKRGLKMAFYDLDWNKLPFITNHEQITEAVEKPHNLDELIAISEKLAADFNHVRVDFYQLNTGEWKFGEMTFTPSGGRHLWNPPEYDRIVGELLDLNHHTMQMKEV